MKKDSRIYVAGHKGLVGSAILRKLKERGHSRLLFADSKELDLMSFEQTERFFRQTRPEYVFLAAAKVGGILSNHTERADFIYENLQVQNNVISRCHVHGVKKLLFPASSCVYPKDCPQPIREDDLMTGPLEYTNEPYAVAKIAGLKMCESYNLQYGADFITVMPTNLFGIHDTYDLEKSHVLPALLRKTHLARCLEEDRWEALRADLDKRPIKGVSGKSPRADILSVLEKFGVRRPGKAASITLWGTGKPFREFMLSDDLADACLHIMNHVDFHDIVRAFSRTDASGDIHEVKNPHINIGTGKDISIFDLAHMIKKIVGLRGEIRWDPSYPDGMPRKRLDISRLKKLGWTPSTNLEKDIRAVYGHYASPAPAL
ncbi:bifunctional GDP-fucose synthetase: GDP-4-dehydro-6-deoxy-D-mannose epimerase and GDP-4-dehydro-6-L-deoxygalactose reductase [Candidatus Desulfarcum epimagneticum]|uniref:GDP-L-fucose synthase n=1 Tax=uncultured Desulfobacteraceae bacterium TaxID=218296 RepID=A0A484HKW5_9BACT|nr:bifunctional GDP-fucose synthetase: GDP-4-dehydro-6-deoxy-D-mannose epimerase and GDP-4-dehydro-6-L-deoxygalactose reductase [uncultured Desulfobacteraceae bacterium]